MSRGDFHNVLPEHLRRYDSGLHGEPSNESDGRRRSLIDSICSRVSIAGWHCVRENDATQAPHADAAVLEVRGDLSARRRADADVPRR